MTRPDSPRRRKTGQSMRQNSGAVPILTFMGEAWPGCIPPNLAALADDAQIAYEADIGGAHEEAMITAGECRRAIEITRARQRMGHFTICEAAQVLADTWPWIIPSEEVALIVATHAAGNLHIYEAASKAKIKPGDEVSAYCDTLNVYEFDFWRRKCTSHRFRPAIVEHPEGRDWRFLALYKREVAAWGERGAIARVAEDENRHGLHRPVHRSTVARAIRRAQQASAGAA